LQNSGEFGKINFYFFPNFHASALKYLQMRENRKKGNQELSPLPGNLKVVYKNLASMSNSFIAIL